MSPATDQAAIWQLYDRDVADFAELDTQVHVWRIALDGIGARVAETLSADERARADRFARAQDRHRFVATRGALRTILADILAVPDTAAQRGRLRLRYGAAGKPVLVDDPGLRFNVSHSGDMAMIAATRSGEVGVDIEQQRRVPNTRIIAGLVFNEAESAAIEGCPPETRDAVFLRIWTRKEALIKAMGVGIAALKEPDAISLDHAGQAWHLSTMPHLKGYVAALARPRAAHGVRLWSWTSRADAADRRLRSRPAAQPTCEVRP